MATNSSSTPLFSLEPVVLDTETTSLDADTAAIVQIGALMIEGGQIVEDPCLDLLINPGKPIPGIASNIHGIFDQDVASAAPFGAVADRIEQLIGERVVIGHSIAYDLTVLMHEYERLNRPWRRPRSLDTQILARVAHATLANFSLEVVAEWLDIDISGRHSALGDARATAEIFLKLIPILRENGIRTLAEAEQACRSFSDINDRHAQAGWIAPIQEETDGDFGVPSLAKIDSYPYRHRVRDVMATPPLVAEAAWPVPKAVEKLVETGFSSVFVNPKAPGEAYGIVTERDLMRTISRHEGNGAWPTLGDIMSTPLITIREHFFVYRAIGRMQRLGVRHLGVEDEDGALVGALTSGDLLRQRATDAIVLGEEIDQARDVVTLGAAWARLPLVARSLLNEGVDVRDITAVISAELCALSRRACQMAETRMAEKGRGGPPVPYVLLVLGSAGRGETLLAPDQDNAILFESGEEDGPEDQWFAELGVILADILNDVGVPYCDGGVMAKNTEWRHSFDDWVAEMKGWIGHAEWQDLLDVIVFFDFRPVYGDERLARKLWHQANQLANRSPGFLKQLAAAATDLRAPLGLFGNIKTEEGRVDLKMGGLLALVSGARILALRHGIDKRPTRDRLEGVKDAGIANADDLNDVMEAHVILLKEIVGQQLSDIATGVPPSNKVVLKSLSKSRREQLRWALGKVEVMNTLVGDPMAFG